MRPLPILQVRGGLRVHRNSGGSVGVGAPPRTRRPPLVELNWASTQLQTCLSLPSYLLFHAFFSGFNLDATEESYNQDPALSIYPKEFTPLPPCVTRNVVKNTVTRCRESVTRYNMLHFIFCYLSGLRRLSSLSSVRITSTILVY